VWPESVLSSVGELQATQVYIYQYPCRYACAFSKPYVIRLEVLATRKNFAAYYEFKRANACTDSVFFMPGG
jgi:hypothetical protein